MELLSQTRRGLGLRTRHQDASSRLVMVTVCAGVVLASLDLFVVNVALPQIARDLHEPDLGTLSWVLNAYAIVYAAALVVLGRLSEGHRRENGFLLGVVVFTAASAACGAAPNLATLVAFRIVQALGAALLTPTSLGLVLATTAPERRHRAVRTWTAVGGLAAAFGPAVGGLLVAESWRLVFYVNVPIGLAAAVVAWRRLPQVPGHPVARPDGLGALAVTAGTAAFTLGLVEGNGWGWASPGTLVALGGGLVLLAAFVVRCLGAPSPLIDPALFRVKTFNGASVVAVVFSVAFGAMLFSRVLWCQDQWGWSALHTGLAIAPGPLMVPICTFLLAGPVIQRFGPGPAMAAGATLFAAGAAWWALAVGTAPDYVGGMLGGMLLTGAGVGFTLPTLMATGAASLPPHALATGSAVLNMFRQLGLAFGVAVLVAVLGTPHSVSSAVTAYRLGWWVTAGTSMVAALAGLAVVGTRARAPQAPPVTPPLAGAPASYQAGQPGATVPCTGP